MKLFYDKEKRKFVIFGIILALMPFFMVFARLLFEGQSFKNVWLGASSWNDELFYFKQVECMVKDTVPNGFFGYNESAAKMLSFGAWSPVILIPWFVFGKIFGWTLISPFICNMLIFSLALGAFVMIVRPESSRILMLIGFLGFLTPLSRYILSCMPEIICISFLILFMAFVFSAYSKGRGKDYIMSFAVLAILVLMRPYYVMFFVFPIAISVYQKKKYYFIGASVAVVSLGGYFVMSDKLNAPYIGEIYRLTFVKTFINEGFKAGVSNLFSELINMGRSIAGAAFRGIKEGDGTGVYFALFLIIMLVLLADTIYYAVKKKTSQLILIGCMLICYIGMLLAIVYMYSIVDGFRHLLAFIVASMFVMAALPISGKGVIGPLTVMTAVFGLCMFRTGNAPDFFAIPYASSQKAEVEALSEQLKEAMYSSDELSWDNVVALVFNDYIGGGSELTLTSWQHLYALPKGFAISICKSDYVMENIDNFKSGYAAVPVGGKTAEQLDAKGAHIVSGDSEILIYKLK